MSAFFRPSGLSATAGILMAGLGPALTLQPVAAGPNTAPARFNHVLRNGPGDANHPVNVVPSENIRIPNGWPVDFRGAITCLTCHEQLPALNESGSPNLRDMDPRDAGGPAFCSRCHSTPAGRSGGNMHWTVIGIAHVRAGDDGQRSAGPLDGDSRQCLGCHDGVTAGEFGFSTSAGSRGFNAIDLRHTHPVGVRYKAMGRSGRNARLRPAMLLPREVRLPSGRVSCVSCHDLYATDRARLAVPIENSHLCFTCHDMD